MLRFFIHKGFIKERTTCLIRQLCLVITRIYVYIAIKSASRRSHSIYSPPLSHKTILTPSLFITSVCTKTGNWTVMYLCARGIDVTSFYHFNIRFQNCSDSVLYLVFHFLLPLDTIWICSTCRKRSFPHSSPVCN